jgi:hypothetical protein
MVDSDNDLLGCCCSGSCGVMTAQSFIYFMFAMVPSCFTTKGYTKVFLCSMELFPKCFCL